MIKWHLSKKTRITLFANIAFINAFDFQLGFTVQE